MEHEILIGTLLILEEHLAMWWVWDLPLEWTHLPALELVLERRLRLSPQGPSCIESCECYDF